MRTSRVLLLVVMLLTAHRPVSAQSGVPGWFSSGSRIRVAVPSLSGDPIVGRLLELSGDSLLLTTGTGVARLNLPLATVTAIDVSQGRDRAHGALLGAGIGLVAGGFLGAAVLSSGGQEAGLDRLVGFFAGIIVGAPLGAVTGGIVAPERWAPAWRPGVRQ